MLPGTRPTLLDTFATIGGYPNASSVGNVINEPDPTTALIPPAPTPAAKIATTSHGVKIIPFAAAFATDSRGVRVYSRQAGVELCAVMTGMPRW